MADGKYYIKPEEYEWSLKSLKKLLRDYKMKSKIILEHNNIAIVHVKSYEDSMKLGANTKWCISQYRDSWNKYVKNNDGIQLFLYDFNITQDDEPECCLIGATIKHIDGEFKVDCSFTRNDLPLFEYLKKKNDNEAFMNFVVKYLFEDIEGDKALKCELQKIIDRKNALNKEIEAKKTLEHKMKKREVKCDSFDLELDNSWMPTVKGTVSTEDLMNFLENSVKYSEPYKIGQRTWQNWDEEPDYYCW